MLVINYQYQGYLIRYDEDKEQFYVSNREGSPPFSAPSLKKLKAMLDKEIATSRKRFAGKTAYRVRRCDTIAEVVTITSVDDDGMHCWIKHEDGQREKASANTLFEVCQENDAVFAEMSINRAEYERLMEKEKSLRTSLKPVSFR